MVNNISFQKSLRRFRIIGIAEGISFLVLLLIAMPMKYFLKIPEAVKIVGWMHGALFVSYIYFAIEVAITFKKNIGWCIKTFLAAFIPMGTFVTDKELKKEEMAL
jgi:integral membrane protein